MKRTLTLLLTFLSLVLACRNANKHSDHALIDEKSNKTEETHSFPQIHSNGTVEAIEWNKLPPILGKLGCPLGTVVKLEGLAPASIIGEEEFIVKKVNDVPVNEIRITLTHYEYSIKKGTIISIIGFEKGEFGGFPISQLDKLNQYGVSIRPDEFPVAFSFYPSFYVMSVPNGSSKRNDWH